jgi:hypothetical protein
MPKRIPPYLAKQTRAHPVATVLVTVVLVLVPSVAIFDHLLNSIQQQSECGDAFADRLYGAVVPRWAAQDRLNAADKTVWEATQAILTSHAKPGDYITLRVAVKHRNRLAQELAAAHKAHPLPPPPSQFC